MSECSGMSNLCNPMDHGLPVSSIHEIFQARILEWVAISYTRGSSQPRDWNCVPCVSYIGGRILHHQVTWKSHLPNNAQILFSMALPRYRQYADCLSNRWASHAPNWSGQLPFGIASWHMASHRPWELVQEWTCYPNSTPVRLLERFAGCIEMCLHFSETATKRESF